MLDTIRNFLKEHEIDERSGFVIAVSGGADSITLLHAFKYLNLRILALHCNFNLRGKESNMDEQFVKRFCDTYGIALSVKKFDTTGHAKEHGMSVEMALARGRWPPGNPGPCGPDGSLSGVLFSDTRAPSVLSGEKNGVPGAYFS